MKLHSLAISGLVTMNLHALNNEGSEGNTMMTRMVEIVGEDGNLYTVKALSGDMFKHIQAEHLFGEAKSASLPLCGGCRRFDANRIACDHELAAEVEKSEEYQKAKSEGKIDSYNLRRVIQACTLDDCEGILLTGWAGSKSLARKSCIEFGWVVGRPETTRTEAYMHAKFVPEGRGAGSGSSKTWDRTFSTGLPPAVSMLWFLILIFTESGAMILPLITNLMMRCEEIAFRPC